MINMIRGIFDQTAGMFPEAVKIIIHRIPADNNGYYQVVAQINDKEAYELIAEQLRQENVKVGHVDEVIFPTVLSIVYTISNAVAYEVDSSTVIEVAQFHGSAGIAELKEHNRFMQRQIEHVVEGLTEICPGEPYGLAVRLSELVYVGPVRSGGRHDSPYFTIGYKNAEALNITFTGVNQANTVREELMKHFRSSN